jgi:uncharacterized membrane protein HdeD (DUF308 family)
MELKSYDKTWLPALKGAFLFLLGLTAMLQVIGSIKTLAILFVVLIGAIGASLIATGLMDRKVKTKTWPVIAGTINIIFAVYLLLKIDSPASGLIWIILVWVIYYALTELIEAAILIKEKNALAALFVLDALLSLLFGYFLYVVIGNFTPQSVFYIGIIALVFGLTNMLSSYILSKA